MLFTILHIFDWLMWIIMVPSVLYILFFALASLLPRRKRSYTDSSSTLHSFLILFPAYHEDEVIINSVNIFLQQDYPDNLYDVAVISDHMLPSTNEYLASLSITLLQPVFEKSSKSKALQYAIEKTDRNYDKIVILDADNVVGSDFLSRLNKVCSEGHQAIQCHRTAKNSENGIAILDGVSEEINNSIFRKGHDRLRLSAGLIGSGMCFDYNWFRNNVHQLNTSVEDRELEALLLHQRIHIHYAEDINVYDEKVKSCKNFQRQRKRWITGQVQSLFLMLPHLPQAVLRRNIDFADKTFQQALIPRSLLLLFTLLFSTLFTITSFFISQLSPLKWWLLFAAVCMAIIIAIPSSLRLQALQQVLHIPRLGWIMTKNLFQINLKDNEFLHTTHGSK